ncbi:LAMI_0F03202g1_1 [Lachancea mirantina]|uniref:LAMI_0F03202g1_1 n=1 Tax=Lachancea mirantina TaxID=1230905 RepID=A0A1G4JX89_9SACH|nr:LAMI_0F03202g1_1 [Lachancea mirantina]
MNAFATVSNLAWYALVATIAWLAANFVAYQLVGFSVGLIDPFRLRIRSLCFRRRFFVKYIYFSPWNRCIVVHGLRVYVDLRPRGESQSNPNAAPNIPVPKWLRKTILSVLNHIQHFNFILEDTQVGPITSEYVTIKGVFKDSKAHVALSVREVSADAKKICTSGEFEIGGQFDEDNAISLHKIHVDCKLKNVRASWDQFEKITSNPTKGNIVQGQKGENNVKFSPDDCIKELESRLAIAYHYASKYERFSFTTDFLQVKDVPFSQVSEVKSATDLLKYEISVSNFAFFIKKLKQGSPGYKLLFSPEDNPIDLKLSVSGLTFGLKQELPEEITETKFYKFCEIPSISLYGDTNILSTKSVAGRTSSNSNTVLKVVGHISSPILDFEVSELSIIKSFQQNAKVFSSYLAWNREDHRDDVNCSSKRSVEGKEAIFTYFQFLLPHLESKITIEDPMILISDGHELLVHQCSLFTVRTKSEKYALSDENEKRKLFYTLENVAELLDYGFNYHDKSLDYKHKILSIDNLSFQSLAQLIPSIRIGMTTTIDSFKLDLSELATLMALNKITRKIDSKMILVENQYFREIYEQFSDGMSSTIRACNRTEAQHRRKEFCPKAVLFKPPPSYCGGWGLTIRDFSAIVGGRSVFMSDEVFNHLHCQSPGDLVDGELRKASHSIDRVRISFTHETKDIPARDDKSNSSSDSTRALAFAFDDIGLEDSSSTLAEERNLPWILTCNFENMVSKLFSETKTRRQQLIPKKILSLSSSVVKIYPELGEDGNCENGQIMISVSMDKVEMMLSLMTIFLVLSVVHTFKETFKRDVNSHATKSKAKEHLLHFSRAKQRSMLGLLMKPGTIAFCKFQAEVDYFKSVLALPNGIKTRVELFSSVMSCPNLHNIYFNGHYFRLCVESPQVSRSWVRMATVTDFKCSADIASMVKQMREDFIEGMPNEPSVILQNEMWHFNIPHQFEMYQLVDNLPTVFKSLKQMIYSLKTSSNNSVINPHVVSPARLPNVKLTSKRWIFSVEDDHFESQVAMIYQVGLLEQKARVEKYELFEKELLRKLSRKRKGVKRSETFQATREIKTCLQDILRRGKGFKSRSFSDLPRTQSSTNFDTFKEDGNDERLFSDMENVTEEFQTLQEHMSKSWIKRIQDIKQKQQIEFMHNFEYLWGRVNINYHEVDKHVVEFLSSPPLMNLIIEGIDVKLSQPSCGIKGIPEFVNDVGKGVPKDTKYSIMIPIHVDARFDEIRCHLRDFPLPFINIPKLAKHQKEQNQKSIHFHGDMMLAEDMLRSNKELRTLFVPLVPSATMENNDTFYSLFVPRTIVPIKIFTELDLELNSTETTTAVWGGSYSPALQQVMQCFENFSKPPIDPSLKLGFWDKIREIFHARIKFRWNNGGQLNVALKGSKNPYSIGGEGAGFVVGLRGNVAVGCNVTEDPRRLVSFSSNEVFFAVPNFFAKPLPVWARSSSESIFVPICEYSNLQEYAFYYNLIEMPDYSKRQLDDDKKTMSDNFFEKRAITLSGGITLNVGMVFDRKKSDGSGKTSETRPHWDVRMCNPLYLENIETHDSFRGFRSDFIHMSFTLLSNSNNAYNTVQLSPGAFRIFFRWWKSFSGVLPVRRGPLFGAGNMSPKFGVHLYTISYHAEVAPLFISHIVSPLDSDHKVHSEKKDSHHFIGLKAKTDHFVMDLHQRREVFHEHKPELNTTKRLSRLKFEEGDISTFEIDIRTVKARFDRETFLENRTSSIEIFDNDMSWYDIGDFCEVYFDRLDKHTPFVEVLPLLYSPKFVYRKKASYGDKYQVELETCKPIEPFRNANYHECSLRPSVRLPVYLVEDRLKALRNQGDRLRERIEKGSSSEALVLLRQKLAKTEQAQVKVSKLVDDFNHLEKGAAAEGDEDGFDKVAYDENLNYDSISWIAKKSSYSKDFENRFFIFSMLLKWNENVRDVVYKYIHLIGMNREFSFITNHKALQKLEDIIGGKNTGEAQLDSVKEDISEPKVPGVEARPYDSMDAKEDTLDVFEKGLRELEVSFKFKTHENHIVNFIAPQIQLTTSQKPDTCILLTAPSIKLKTLGFDSNMSENESKTDVFLNRYGVALLRANVFVFHKDNFDDFHDIFFKSHGYGESGKDNWQPWLGIELCFDSTPLTPNTLIRDFSGIFKYDKVFPFANVGGSKDFDLQNKMIFQLPKLIISSNSRQYLALYNMIMDLLVYTEPRSAHLKKEVEKLMLSYDSTNLVHLADIVRELQKTSISINWIEKELAFKRQILDDAGMDDLKSIRRNKFESLTNLYILMKVLNAGSKEQAAEGQHLLWNIEAKEIILHMLHDDGSPFLDVALAKSYFQRAESTYGSNNNKLVIGVAQIFNLERRVLFNDLMGPMLTRPHSAMNVDKKPLIHVVWDIEKPIGGIKVIKEIETHIQALDVNIEQETVAKIIQWAFPTEVETLLHNNHSSQSSDADSDSESDTDEEIVSVGGDETNGSARASISKTYNGGNKGFAERSERSYGVDEMVKRSSDYMVINNLLINSFKLRISYRGHGAQRLINVTHFAFVFPRLEFKNETITTMELTLHLKKVILKSLVKHVGKFLGNKLRAHKIEANRSDSSLNQLSQYQSYTTIDDLKNEKHQSP